MNRAATTGLLLTVVLTAWPLDCPGQSIPASDFRRDIQPLFDARCAQCHGPERQKGGLRLDSRDIAFRGGDSGYPALVPGSPQKSALVERVSTSDPTRRMPPKGDPLSSHEIDLLRRWIVNGAVWPDQANVSVSHEQENRELEITDADREHWAFRPLSDSDAQSTSTNLIDGYLGDSIGNREASRHTLIRRLTFDLLGLPPTPAEIDAFVQDHAPDAYERLVDRLLANKHYGERWARHWLDVARYADSDGYESDLDRPEAWPYRDWVIRAFNDDLAFDTFVKWQVAGDEYEPDNPDAVIATGFLAAGPWQTTTPSNTKENKLKIRYDELDDMVSTTGAAFLGLTLGCARCHDHKFDPIPTRDYYRMVAAFSTSERRVASLSKPRREFKKWTEVKRREWREWKMAELGLDEDQKFWLRQAEHFYVPIQVELYKKFGKLLTVSDEDLRAWLPPSQQAIWAGFDRALSTATMEGYPAEKALVVLDRQGQPAPEFLLERGGVLSRKEDVTFGVLRVLMRGKSPEDYWRQARPSDAREPRERVGRNGFMHPPTTYQRKALAEWITDIESGAGPLLARVTMNRLWQYHFGDGFTPTPNDIGFQGAAPRHPALLETLASAFVAGGWRLKPIHKMILMSKAYRQPSPSGPEPSRHGMSRRAIRLEAEVLRDAMLAVSGRLNRKMFGPPFRSKIPKEAISTRSKDAYPTDIQDGPDLWRRSIYAFSKRSVRIPMMEVFDAPDPGASCGRRNRTTVPTQALTLMNSEMVRVCALQFAQRVMTAAGFDPERQIDHAYLTALGRPPCESELRRASQFLAEAIDARGDGIPVEGLTDLCHVLFTLNEFAYVD